MDHSAGPDLHKLQQDLDGVDARVGLGVSQAGQIASLGPLTSGVRLESAPLHACSQGWFTLACGEG